MKRFINPRKPDLSSLEARAEGLVSHRYPCFATDNQLRYERSYEELELDDLTQNIRLRKLYAGLLFGILVFWVLVIMYVVLSTASGCQIFMPHVSFRLSDAVVIILITTTTANVVGFFFAVTNYLFPKGTSEMRKAPS